MTIIQAVILGIVQGLTEFLPVSSSAHLVLVPSLLNWEMDPQISFGFNVLVQVGTLLGVITFFWKDLVEIIVHFLSGLLQRKPFATEPARLGWYLILATLPAGILGLLIKDLVEAAFSSPVVTAVFLLVTAALLAFADYMTKRQATHSASPSSVVNWQDALVMGFGQALAIFPGISRSGATITSGIVRGLDRPTAARFSFLMSIPIMLAAGLLASLDLLDIPNLGASILPIAAGFITAGIIGYLSIAWLLRYLVHHSLAVFSIYCAAVGLLSLIFFLFKG